MASSGPRYDPLSQPARLEKLLAARVIRPIGARGLAPRPVVSRPTCSGRAPWKNIGTPSRWKSGVNRRSRMGMVVASRLDPAQALPGHFRPRAGEPQARHWTISGIDLGIGAKVRGMRAALCLLGLAVTPLIALAENQTWSCRQHLPASPATLILTTEPATVQLVGSDAGPMPARYSREGLQARWDWGAPAPGSIRYSLLIHPGGVGDCHEAGPGHEGEGSTEKRYQCEPLAPPAGSVTDIPPGIAPTE